VARWDRLERLRGSRAGIDTAQMERLLGLAGSLFCSKLHVLPHKQKDDMVTSDTVTRGIKKVSFQPK
jgi:hypothetical protein